MIFSVFGDSTLPNILMIVIDDMGYNDIGYHNSEIYSPNIDSLAEKGVRLETFYADRECTPSRAALLTGYYNIRTGMQDTVIWRTEPRGVPLSFTLLPQKLADVGYQTFAVGKWHLGFYQEDYCPWRRGFQKFYGLLAELGEQFTHESSMIYKIRGKYSDEDLMSGKYLIEADSATDTWNGVPDNDTANIHTTYLYTEKAIEYMDTVPEDSPFFMYLSYQAVHFPMEVDNAFVKLGNCNVISIPSDDDKSYNQTNMQNRIKLCGMVAQLDLSMTKIRDYLQSKDIWENTVLIFLSDNGGEKNQGGNNYPFLGEKGDYLEGGIRTPAFISGGYIEKQLHENNVGSYEFTDIVHITDLHALILGLAGIESSGIDGIDFYDRMMQLIDEPVRNEVLININSDLFGGGGALRYGDYKLIKHPKPKEFEFYVK